MKPQRLDLRYCIAWKGRWHVGSGYQAAVADRLLRRLPNGSPFVPGAQIKGVLRHQCERLALTLGLEAVDPHASSKEHGQHLVKHFTPLAKSKLMVDRLFGNRYQGECMFVTNAVPTSSEAKSTAPVQTRPSACPNASKSKSRKSTAPVQTRTAIDRITRTVMERHLFTTELTEGDIELQGTIRARHPAGVLTQYEDGFPYEYSLLIAGLLSLDALGGDKSVGLGRCEINLKEKALRWNDESITKKDALQSFDEPEWGVMLEMVREESTS